MLSLKDKTPLARGTHQALYEVEDCPGVIIKVTQTPAPRPRTVAKRVKQFFNRRFPVFKDRSWKREYGEYIRLKRRQLDRSDPFPAADFMGLVCTDLGVGKVFEKIQDGDGRPGPSLGALFSSGRLPEYLPLLNDFAQSLFRWEIRANDVNRGNIVLGTRRSRKQFVLVDGLGDSHVIPVRTWSRAWNERSLHKRLAKTGSRVHLIWDAAGKQFSRKEIR